MTPTVVDVVRLSCGDAVDPYGIAAAVDGALWVTHGGGIVRIAADGSVRAHPTEPGARPAAVTVAPDGSAWFTRTGDDRITAVRPDGTTDTVTLDTGSGPFGICVGPDGAILMPCGRCRQVLLEHGGPDMLVDHPAGARPLGLLLPDAFGPDDLTRGSGENA